MTNCTACKSDRIVNIGGKCSDMCNGNYKGVDIDGYVPYDIGVGGGDYLEFSFCLNCGTIQGKFPIEGEPEFYVEAQEEMENDDED